MQVVVPIHMDFNRIAYFHETQKNSTPNSTHNRCDRFLRFVTTWVTAMLDLRVKCRYGS